MVGIFSNTTNKIPEEALVYLIISPVPTYPHFSPQKEWHIPGAMLILLLVSRLKTSRDNYPLLFPCQLENPLFCSPLIDGNCHFCLPDKHTYNENIVYYASIILYWLSLVFYSFFQNCLLQLWNDSCISNMTPFSI